MIIDKTTNPRTLVPDEGYLLINANDESFENPFEIAYIPDNIDITICKKLFKEVSIESLEIEATLI